MTETAHSLYANFPNYHPLFLGELEAVRFPRKARLVDQLRRELHHDAGRSAAQRSGRAYQSRSQYSRKTHCSGSGHSVRGADGHPRSFRCLDGMLTKDRMAKIRANRLVQVSALTAQLKQSREMALRARFDSSPLTWERVGYELEKVLDKDAVIVPEVGTQYYKVLRQLTIGGPNKQKIGRTVGQALGWGVAAAFGVNVALPERQIVALQGDGGFLFGQSETLWSISRYEAPMLIVIFNNHVYNESRDRNMQNGGHFYEEGKDFDGYLGAPNVEYTQNRGSLRLERRKSDQRRRSARGIATKSEEHAGRQGRRAGCRYRSRWTGFEPRHLVSAPLHCGNQKEEAEYYRVRKSAQDFWRVRMHGRRKKNKILFLLVCNLALCVTAADLGGGLAAQVSASATNDQQAQIEKGRQAVGQTCAACHAGILRMAQAQKQTEEQWKDTIYSMIGRGAEILPDEIEPMAAFLAATSARSGPANAQAGPDAWGRGSAGAPEGRTNRGRTRMPEPYFSEPASSAMIWPRRRQNCLRTIGMQSSQK